jgi:hypothetical protein
LAPDIPVRLPAKTPGVVPLDRVSEFPPKGKGDPVIRQAIFQKKQLRAGTGNTFFPGKYRLYFIPSL